MLNKHGSGLSSIREFDYHKHLANDMYVEIERDVSVAMVCIRDGHLSTSICLNSAQVHALYTHLPDIIHARDTFQDSMNYEDRILDSF
jgi:hypothetical protein